MKWKYETFEQKEQRLGQWHKYFCWLPVSYKGTTYWLCYIERKIILDRWWGDWHYYREIK